MPKKSKTAPNATFSAELVPIRTDSNLLSFLRCHDADRLSSWCRVYEELEGQAKSDNTRAAKQRDLQLFLDFFALKVGTDHRDDWTKPVTTGFLRHLETATVLHRGAQVQRKAATVNRVFSTLRHFAGWVHAKKPFLAGNPCTGVKELVTDEPAWKGLDDTEVMRLKSAAEQLLRLKTRSDQSAARDKAIFLVLLHTGVRVSELVDIDRHQFRSKHLTDVKRKGKLRSAKIFLPKEAKEALDAYLKERGDRGGPLFLTRSGERLNRQDVDWLLRGLAAQANAQRGKDKQIRFSAHTLRHTFLRKVAAKHGVEFAMQAAGHASTKYIWRYVKPSDEQTEAALEGLF